MKDRDAVKEKILSDEDFIYCPRLGNSLVRLMEKNPEGIDKDRISKVLLLTEEEVVNIYDEAIRKLKQNLGL